MNWSDLLSTEKLMPEEDESKQFAEYPINLFEKDYRKIVYSAAFRRLQDKTKVFPLDSPHIHDCPCRHDESDV